MFACLLRRCADSTVLFEPKLLADSVGTEQRGDTEWPLSAAVTTSARLWRKVPESDARRVGSSATEEGGGGGSSVSIRTIWVLFVLE